MQRNWKEDLTKFESFLQKIPLHRYASLRKIKTVEQDLPRDLLPLELYYQYYWDTTDFRNYDEIFRIYWEEKLSPHIYEFVKRYFYGCSLQFVEEGFKARLYRIWMSVLTQFHFQYLWNALFNEKLDSSAALNKMGIDAIVNIKNYKIALQIKKVSYRREASNRRFTQRQKHYADISVEIPYLVLDAEDIKNKLQNPRVHLKTKQKYKSALKVFNQHFVKLDNGFVIFRKSYLLHIHRTIFKKLVGVSRGEKIPYDEILLW